MAKLDELQSTREKLAADMRALAKSEATWTAEDTAKWTELSAAYDANKASLDSERTAVETAAAQKAAIDARIKGIDTDLAVANFGREIGRGPIGDDGANSLDNRQRVQVLALQGWMLANSPGMSNHVKDEHKEAVRSLGYNLHDREIVLRVGPTESFRSVQNHYSCGTISNGGNARNFQNIMQVGKGTTGGFLVGETFLARLEQAMLDYSGVLQVAEVIRTTTGEALIWPTMDDTGNTGTRVGEGEDVGTGSDPTVGRLRLGANTFTSKVLKVSRSLLTDSPLNLESLLGEMLGTRIGRKMNTDFTTGAGGGTAPQGIVVGSSVGKTAASASAIVFDELVDLMHSVDPAYRGRPGVGYMMHDGILQVIRKLKDGNGQYLWSNGTQASEPDRINGFPYWINQAMQATVATATKTVLFGLLSAYKVRQVNEIRIQRLVERGAELDEDWFIAYLRGDGGLLNPGVNPVKHLLQA